MNAAPGRHLEEAGCFGLTARASRTRTITGRSTTNLVWSQGKEDNAAPRTNQRAADPSSRFTIQRTAHATSSAAGVSGKMSQACGTIGTVRNTAIQVQIAAFTPATVFATSNIARAASAAMTQIATTTPWYPDAAWTGRSSAGSPGAWTE